MIQKSTRAEEPSVDRVQDKSERGSKSYQEGNSFEERVAELYRLLHYDVVHGRLFSGRQVDIFLTGHFGDLTIYRAIECKIGPVKADHIDTFIAKLHLVRREYPSAQGTIVSGVSFTDAITSQAAQEGIQLTLYRDLAAQLLDGHGYARNIIRECELNDRYPMPLYIEPFIGSGPAGKATIATQILDEWLQDNQSNQLTLLGDVGTGKSFLSRMLAYRLASNFLAKPLENPFPILVDLRNADRQFSLEGLILTHLAQSGLVRVSFEAFQYALSQGSIVLILDGFDEMASRVTPQISTRNFHELSRAVLGRAKVLLTCRTHFFKSRTEEEEVILGSSKDYGSETARDLYWELISRKGFKILYLRPFEIFQIEEYVKRAKPNNADVALNRIRNTYNLMELSQRPMLLEMIVKSIEKLTATEINSASLYMVYTDTWIHRDQWRDVLSPAEKLSFLMALAHSLWNEDTRSVHYTKLIEYLQQKLASHIQNTQQLFEIDNEIRTASFLTRDNEGNYGFAHKSYAEYFLARYLASELNSGRLDCLQTRRYSQETISFLQYMLEMEKVFPLLENILVSAYTPLTSENALACLYGFQREVFLNSQQCIKEEAAIKLKVLLPNKMCLAGAQLDQMSLEGAVLVYVDLTDANLSQAVLVDTDLSHATLKGAMVEKADLTRATLSWADLSGAMLAGANLESADLTHTVFVNADLKGSFLINTKYSHADLTGANLARAALPDDLSASLGRITKGASLQERIIRDSNLDLPKYRAVIERLYPHMLKMARLLSFRLDCDAEDIAQEAVVALLNARAMEKLNNLSEEQQEQYARTTIKNLAISSHNKQSRTQSFNFHAEIDTDDTVDQIELIPSSEPSAEDVLITSELVMLLSELESILPPRSWRILKARYVDGMSLHDIADMEGISLPSASRYLGKAFEIARRHSKLFSAIDLSSLDRSGDRQ